MTKNHNVACAIRACREARGYSQEYMADMLDICQSAYANLEAGKTSLSIERLIKIASLLDADIHELIDASVLHENSPGRSLHTSAIRLQDDTKRAYDALITELKTEVEFLKELIREKRAF